VENPQLIKKIKMKIGVLSDSHDNISHLNEAFQIFNREKVVITFFLGDLTLAPTLAAFRQSEAPVKAVFGNLDQDKKNILEKIKNEDINVQYPPGEGLKWDLMINGKRVCVFHGHNSQVDEDRVKSGIFDFVFRGHTHWPKVEKIGKTLLVNPGGICGWADLERKPVKPSLAIVSLHPPQAEIISLMP